MSKKRPSDIKSVASTSKRRHLTENNDVIPHNFPLSQSNEAIRSGKITKIHLTNFMCHSNFSMVFHNRVNLLIGSNGSGKSAVLTALIVGLGAKARDTSRSSSIKQLVKNGQSSAEIEITIANNGSDSYDNDLYGDFITICRHITASGSSQYKIKNESGHIISKKADDLHKILLYHNIQTDNPVFVLNQDSSRTFLKEMEPTKNYQLFLKATQIETIIEKLNQCGLMYNKYKHKLEILKKETAVMVQQIEQLKEKYERLQSADQIKIKIEEHKIEQLWLQVEKQEVIVAELNNVISKLITDREKYQNLIDNKSSAEEEYKIQIHNLQTQLQEKNNSFRTENEILKNLKNALNLANENYENENYQLKKLSNNIIRFKDDINTIDNKIAERSESEISSTQKVRAINENLLVKLTHEQQDIVALIEQQKRDLEMVNETKLKYEEDFERLKNHRKNHMEKIEKLKYEVSALNSSSKDEISIYGVSMARFLDEINRAFKQGAFSALPRGPLGRYIEVPNQKWRGPTELLLQGLLKVFIVNNRNDQIVLDKIKWNFKDFKPVIITVKFHNKVYNVSEGMVYPPKGTVLLMNEIKCNDPVVMNCLIDRANIETILLCENQDLAVQLTSHRENVPQNLRRLILLKPFLEYLPAPLYRIYTLEPRNPQYIQVNLAEKKSIIDNMISQTEKEKSDCENKLRGLKTKLQEIYKQIKQNEYIMENHQRTNITYTDKIQEIKSIEYPEESQIDFYKNEKLQLEKKIQQMSNDINLKEKSLKELLQLKIDSEKEFHNQKHHINNNEKEINHIKAEIDESQFTLNSLLTDARHWEKKKIDLVNNIEQKNIELNNENSNLNKHMEIASKKGERIPITKTDEELEDIIKKYEHHLKQISSTQDSIEDVKALLEDKELKYQKNDTFIVIISQTLELQVLKVKNFVGEITIDHKEKKLNMKVIPRDNHLSNAVSNTKSLSGGERSYSTIALLLSLWSCVDHPFYFLDEYDVFTDDINREIMTKLLLSEAEKKPHRQYTFLTPQDISFVQATDVVSIHRLADPKR